MSDKELQPALAIGEIEQGPSKFEQFLDRNQKSLLIGGVVLVILVAGFIVLRGVQQNKKLDAGAALVGAKEASDYETVIEKYRGTPSAGSALLILSDKQWEAGEKDAALQSLEKFLEEYPKHPSHSLGLVKAGVRFAQNDSAAEASEYFQKAIATDNVTVAPLAQLLLSDQNILSGDLEVAKQLLVEAGNMSETDLGGLKPLIDKRLVTAKSPQPQVVISEPEVSASEGEVVE